MADTKAFFNAIQALGNKHHHVRLQAVTTLGNLLTEHGEAVPTEEIRIAVRCLGEHVTDDDEGTAIKACDCLLALGASAVVVFPELAHACLDKRQAVGMAATSALIKLVRINEATRRKGGEILPTLAAGMMEVHPDVVSQIAAIFRALEADAHPAVQQLVKDFLQAEPEGTIEKWREKITGRYRKRRRRCIEMLGKVGPVASPALPALKEFLKNDDPALQQLARSVIIRIRRTAEAGS